MYDDNFLHETLLHAFENEEFYNVPQGIMRFDYGNDHGWWVRVSRDRVMFRELFSDGKHGSIQEALKQAIIRRHEILSSFPVTIKKISSRNLPINPEERITRHIDKGKLQPYIYWQARWYDKDHKVKFANFPVFTLGEEKAKSLALEAARSNHNKKPKLSKVADQYLKKQFKSITRADVAILSSIDTPRNRSSDIENINKISTYDPFGFEGERKIELHKSIERDRSLRNKKISIFLEEHSRLFCELCSFNFLENYPFLVTDIIEVHHIIPLATLSKGKIVNHTDLMLLCSNCHFAVHQGDAEDNLLLLMDHFESINSSKDQK
jgi:predicted HNH restriction endonuclease